MANYDARYLFACLDATRGAIPPGSELWARVAGRLPRTPTALYAEPFVAEQIDPAEGEPAIDVRYVSLSTVNRSPPKSVAATLQDSDIVEHYTAAKNASWDREVRRNI